MNKKFTATAKNVVFQGKEITVTSLTPNLSHEQREKRKREIEYLLYEVFSKYASKRTALPKNKPLTAA
ncbi:MAG: hypothetical protein LBO63_04590 [Oscillospiraceae bacterium]|jgi:hypothetical protein|nr:hypothetical protein [Oscillospiraceae bacterium]